MTTRALEADPEHPKALYRHTRALLGLAEACVPEDRACTPLDRLRQQSGQHIKGHEIYFRMCI